jgi:hypothetical protein
MKCSFCGSEVNRLHSHHLIPRYLSGTEEDIIEVCPKCHNMLESGFQNFLKYSQFEPVPWHDYETEKSTSCELCGKTHVRICSHHLIPRYLGGDGGDTIEVCQNCHFKLEKRFWNFLVWDSFKARKWQNYTKQLQRNAEYQKLNYPKRLAYLQEYRAKNPEKVKLWKAKCYQNHLAEYRARNSERQKRWRMEHPEEAKIRDRLYYQKDKAKKLAYMKEYRRRKKHESAILVA